VLEVDLTHADQTDLLPAVAPSGVTLIRPRVRGYPGLP
jgi:hypothetical protein